LARDDSKTGACLKSHENKPGNTMLFAKEGSVLVIFYFTNFANGLAICPYLTVDFMVLTPNTLPAVFP
jgi:hypothetical protein